VPGPNQGWLYLKDEEGSPREIINHARTAAYLRNPALAIAGVDICNVLEFGGCRGFAFEPPCADGEEGYAWWRTTANTSRLSASDAAALDITGDISLIVDFAADDYTPGAVNFLIGKWSTAAQLSYALVLDGFGNPEFRWTTAGTTVLSIPADANLGGLGGGARVALRVDFDANNGAAGRTAHFFIAPTIAGPWERLGTPRTTATATTIHSGTSTLEIGSSNVLAGGLPKKIFAAQVRTGPTFTETIAGTAVLTYDGDSIPNAAASSFPATTGQTITVVGAGANFSLNPGETFWEELFFTTPALDDAPWYNPVYPESADALGFFVEEWTGLDSPHVARAVSPRQYGGQLGTLKASQRVMKLNVIAFARTERAMEYLFRWLEATLGSVCSGCATDEILIRRFCPTDLSQLWEGVVELREVGLVEGVTWENDLSDVNRCFIRRLSFALAAGDPCMYLPGTNGPAPTVADVATCLDNITTNEGFENCRPSCVELHSTCRTSFTFEVNPMAAMAPIVTLENYETDHSAPVRALVYADPNDIGISPNPCGLPLLGQLYVNPLPPASELVWDVVARQVIYRDPATGGDRGGWAFIGANDVDPTIPRFFALPCGKIHVVLELASRCIYEDPGSGNWYSGLTLLGAPPHYPAASLQLQERVGCP
jgi:hypothetical protein